MIHTFPVETQGTIDFMTLMDDGVTVITPTIPGCSFRKLRHYDLETGTEVTSIIVIYNVVGREFFSYVSLFTKWRVTSVHNAFYDVLAFGHGLGSTVKRTNQVRKWTR